jgi:hypothetical protein
MGGSSMGGSSMGGSSNGSAQGAGAAMQAADAIDLVHAYGAAKAPHWGGGRCAGPPPPPSTKPEEPTNHVKVRRFF